MEPHQLSVVTRRRCPSVSAPCVVNRSSQIPMVIGWLRAERERFRESLAGHVPQGSTVVVTAGWPFARPGTTNLLHVATV